MSAAKDFLPTSLMRIQRALVMNLLSWIPKEPGKQLRNFFYRGVLADIGESVSIESGVRFIEPHKIAIGNHVEIERFSCIDAFFPGGQIQLGDHVRLGESVRLKTDGDNGKICLKDGVSLDRGVDIKAHPSGLVEIDQGTYIGPYVCMAGPGHIKIGQDCMLAAHTGIYANNHRFDDPDRKICEQGLTVAGIVIEDDCWLGTGVKVLDGVTIGRGSVIGAGAVVTRDIPPFSVAVGVPAKVIAKRDGKNTQSEQPPTKMMAESR